MNAIERRNTLILGIGALVGWQIVFSAGVLIGSQPYRDALATGQGNMAVNFFAAMLLYTPTNAAILSGLAGMVGGCASLLVCHRNGLDKVLESQQADNERETAKLKRRVAYMNESPFLSLLRGFVVYLTFLAGILIATEEPFSKVSGPTFMRYAGFISLVAFGMGYDPTRFEQMMENIPVVGGKNKKDGSPEPGEAKNVTNGSHGSAKANGKPARKERAGRS